MIFRGNFVLLTNYTPYSGQSYFSKLRRTRRFKRVIAVFWTTLLEDIGDRFKLRLSSSPLSLSGFWIKIFVDLPPDDGSRAKNFRYFLSDRKTNSSLAWCIWSSVFRCTLSFLKDAVAKVLESSVNLLPLRTSSSKYVPGRTTTKLSRSHTRQNLLKGFSCIRIAVVSQIVVRARLQTVTCSHSRSLEHLVFLQYSFHLVYLLRQSSNHTVQCYYCCSVRSTIQPSNSSWEVQCCADYFRRVSILKSVKC